LPIVDEALFAFATDVQAKYLRAINEHGSGGAAAKALGVDKSAVNNARVAVLRKAARAGYAPGHFVDGVAPGYRMGKVTVQRGPNGVERV
jgi:hypothetical protein